MMRSAPLAPEAPDGLLAWSAVRSGRLRWVPFALAIAACDGSGPVDAGADGATDAGAPIVTRPPDIPWLAAGQPPIDPPAAPVLTPCAPGWREVAPDGPDAVATCDPYPESGVEECGYGEAHFPGEPGCRSIGAPCPAAGAFADGLSDDGSVIFVDEAASVAGDGTRARPFQTLAEAIPLATRGMTIALSQGFYVEDFDAPEGVTLRGACTARTVLSARTSGGLAVVTVSRPDVVLRDLVIGESARRGILVRGPSASLRLEGVMVTAATSEGIIVDEGGSLTGEDLLVRRTRASGLDATMGRGIDLRNGATAELSRVVLEDNLEVAALVSHAGTRLRLTDASIRRTQAREADGFAGHALAVVLGASAEVERAELVDNRDAAVMIDGADSMGTSARLSDVVVRGTLAAEGDGTAGVGVSVRRGGEVELARGHMVENHTDGVLSAEPGSVARLTDAFIVGTLPQPSDGHAGRGIDVELGGHVEVRRALLTRNHEVGVFVGGADATLDLQDLRIVDTRPRVDELAGAGMAVSNGGSAAGARLVVERSREVGVIVERPDPGTPPAQLVVEDLIVREILGRADGLLGRGLQVQQGSRAQITRALFERTREMAVTAAAEGSSVELVDVAVRDARSRACANTSCAREPIGFGVASILGSSVSLTRFLVERAELCGLFLARDGEIDLATGVVADNPIGVCLQVDGYDVSRLSDNVFFEGNDTRIEATSHVVSEPVTPSTL